MWNKLFYKATETSMVAVLVLFLAGAGSFLAGGWENVQRFFMLPDQVAQVQAELDARRATTTEIVSWAPRISQKLTTEQGPCRINTDRCTVVVVGRRTVEGLSCQTVSADMRAQTISMPNALQLSISPDWAPVQLDLDYEAVEVPFIPRHPLLSPGVAGIFFVTLYSGCEFSGRQIVERESITVLVEFVDHGG